MSAAVKHTPLLPCPFCGSDNDELMIFCDPMEGRDNSGPSRRIQCAGCNIEAPFYPTEAEAIAAWNRRFPDPVREKLVEALRGNWHGVFLDGRNEHGSHVIRLPHRSIELEQDEGGDFLKFIAETILQDAEALGFAVGNAVVATFDMCTDDGFFSHYEYAGISSDLTAALYGSPEDQSALLAKGEKV